MNKQESLENIGAGCGRMSAKNVLIHSVERKNRRVEALNILIKNIPWDSLSEKDEGLLWGLFTDVGW